MKTGYPSIDKPWLKYYTEEMINAVQPNISMYQYIELGTVQKVVLIYERFNVSGDKQDYILNLEYSRVA